MSEAKQVSGRRTTSVAAYPHDVVVLRAVAAVAGRLPADVIQVALKEWLQGQPDLVRAVAEAADERFAQESGA